MDGASQGSRGQTRRALLKGAGGAAAGIAGAGLVPSAALAHDPGRPKPPFDVRDLVEGAEQDNEQIQSYYDTINRSVILAGEIPFKRLFGKPMRWLAPRIEANVPEAATYGLLDDPESVVQLLRGLADSAADLSMTDFFTSRIAEIDGEVRETLFSLRQHGVLAPLPTSSAKSGRKRMKAIRGVRRDLGEESVLSYFTTPKAHLDEAQLETLNLAKATSLLRCGNNDRCCKTIRDTGGDPPFPIEQKCIPMEGKNCFISQSPITRGLCLADSDECPKKK